jgi:hypothetical protein
MRIRARSLAGVPLEDLNGFELPYLEDGWQQLEFAGIAHLFELIEFWGVPCTIAPPEVGVGYWSIEAEDGTHAVDSLLDSPQYNPYVVRDDKVDA